MKLTIDLPDSWTVVEIDPLKIFLSTIGYRMTTDSHGNLIARMSQPPVNKTKDRKWPPSCGGLVMDDLTRELTSALRKIVDELRSDDDLSLTNTYTQREKKEACARYEKNRKLIQEINSILERYNEAVVDEELKMKLRHPPPPPPNPSQKPPSTLIKLF